jgi:hypothetical protein
MTYFRGFEHIVPLDDTTCRAYIAQNLKRGMDYDVFDAVAHHRLTIIASGPSARNIDLRSVEGPTLAVNGAMKLFTDQGVAPTFWAACDPQAVVADFLPDKPPGDTTYLLAAKCHPSVFDKLKNNEVRIWHTSDYPVPGKTRFPVSCSITVTILWVMFRLGFTDFDFWGWDGCFMDGRRYAYSADAVPANAVTLVFGGEVIGSDQVAGGRAFLTTPTWAAESEAANQLFVLADYFDIGLTINGDGMFSHAYEFWKGK